MTDEQTMLECAHPVKEFGEAGFTKRERAAIDLRVPDSGLAWLDAMIREANLREVAIAMLPSINGRSGMTLESDTEEAWQCADALLNAKPGESNE